MVGSRAVLIAAITLFSCSLSRGAALSPPLGKLKIWVSADRLALKDGEPVSSWPDLSGDRLDLTSSNGTSPTFVAAGPGGHPTVAFHGDTRRKPPINSILNIPLTGEWPEVTVIFAGRKFASPSLINTADMTGALFSPGTAGYQLLNEPIKVPAFAQPPADPGIAEVVTITAGFDEAGVMRLTTYQNGKMVGTAREPTVTLGIMFRNGMLGTKNIFGYGPFDGDVSEMLLYQAALTEPQRQSAERYLMVKYGLLPGNGDVVAPAVPLVHALEKVHHADAGEPAKAGLQLWARPEELPAADGAALARWPDASGHHNDMTAEGAAIPKSSGEGIAGYPIAVMAGDKTKSPPLNQYLTMPLRGEWKQVTMILVGDGFKPDGLFDTAPGTENSLQEWYGGDVRFWGGDRVEAHDAFKILDQLSEKQMVEVTFRIDDHGQELNTYVNGLQQQHHVSLPAAMKKPFAFSIGQLGNDSRYNDHYKVRLSEVLVYDRVLTDEERRATEDYLCRKYDLLRLTPESAARARSTFSLGTVHLPTTQSWVGNTFPGFVPEVGAPGYDWVQSGISDIMALPDGTVVASSIYDEAGKAIGFYKDGKPLPTMAPIGTGSMCTDGSYLYLAVSGMNKPRAGVRRFTLDLKEALWPEFKEGDAVWFATAKPWMEEAGIVAIGDNLYISIDGSTALNVVNKVTGKVVGTVPCPAQPARLAVGANGTIWAALPDSVVQLTTDGTLTGRKVTGVKPGGIAVDPAGHLMVADTDKRQQIITYDVSGIEAREIAALGVRGGVWAGPHPGEMGADRLFEVTALTVDGAGNVYANVAAHQIRAFSPEGKQLWHIEDTCFCTVGDFDPASDANDYYTGVDHYAYSPDQPGKDWIWKGITYDRARFPEMALGSNAAVQLRRINGVLLRYSMSDGLKIHRKEPDSEIFVPCGDYCTLAGKDGVRPKAAPAQGRYLWVDKNDDGLITPDEITQPDAAAKPNQPSYNIWVDSKGGIWEPEDRLGMRYIPMKGMTRAGAPIYDFADQVWTSRPKEFITVLRCLYFPETNTMYLSGLTWDHPAKGNESWGNCGREAIRYDNWTKPTRHLVSRMPFPDNAWTLIAMSVSDDTHRLYVGEMGTAVVFVYDADSGKFIGCLEQDMKLFGRNPGWIDQSGGVRAFTCRNGETVVLAEDSYLEKTVIYRIPPGGMK
jgi:hypothetical protein